MKKGRKVNVYIIIGIILVAAAIIILASQLANKQTAGNNSECKTDSDCVKATIGCCPCNMGGEEKCLPKDEVPMFKCPAPDKLICTQVDNCKMESCKCVKSKCAGT